MKKNLFFQLFIFFLSFNSWVHASEIILTEGDMNMIENKIIEELTNWCDDTYCAGDYSYSWKNFKYDHKNGEWVLEFVICPHFDEDKETIVEFFVPGFSRALKKTSVKPAERHFCTLPSKHPLEMIKFQYSDGNLEIEGISEKMREMLGEYSIAAEQNLRQ